MRKIQIAGYGIESAELPEDMETLAQEGENLEEATEALEAFALLLQPAVEGYAMNPAALEAMSVVTNRLVRKAGLPTLSVGTESMVVDTVQQAASLGLEDIKEHLKNAAIAVWEYIKKIGKWIAEKARQLVQSSKSTVEAAIKTLTKIKDKQDLGSVKLTIAPSNSSTENSGNKTTVVLALPAPKGEEPVNKEVECDLSTLYANGKFSADVVRQISEVASIIWRKEPVITKTRDIHIKQTEEIEEFVEDALTKIESGQTIPNEEVTAKLMEIRKKAAEDMWRAARDTFGVASDTGQWQGSIGSKELFLKPSLALEHPYSVCFEYVEEPHESVAKVTTLKDLGLDTSKVNDALKWLEVIGDTLNTHTSRMTHAAMGVVNDKDRLANSTHYSKLKDQMANAEFLLRTHERALAAAWRDMHAVYKLNYGIEVALIKALRTLGQLANAVA